MVCLPQEYPCQGMWGTVCGIFDEEMALLKATIRMLFSKENQMR